MQVLSWLNLEDISYKMYSFYLVIVESYKNTPPLNEDSVLFTKNRTSIGKVSNHYTSVANFISQTFVTIHKIICCLIRWWYNFLSKTFHIVQ